MRLYKAVLRSILDPKISRALLGPNISCESNKRYIRVISYNLPKKKKFNPLPKTM